MKYDSKMKSEKVRGSKQREGKKIKSVTIRYQDNRDGGAEVQTMTGRGEDLDRYQRAPANFGSVGISPQYRNQGDGPNEHGNT